MKKLAFVAAALILGAIPTGAASSAADTRGAGGGVLKRAVTCHGQTATIIGHGFITGTDGPDVIVTDGSANVDALGGNDAICVAGPSTALDAGAGDDYVEVEGSGDVSSGAQLGDGDDTFVGGPAGDVVYAGLNGSESSDTGHDTISTYGGMDSVYSGQTGSPNTDVLDLGDDSDTVRLSGVDHAAATINGGGGFDNLESDLPLTTEGDWVFNNQTQTATLNGQTALTWDSFQKFNVGSFRGTTQTFIGNAQDEDVNLISPESVSADMGGGDDRIQVEFSTVVGDALRGGTGSDTLAVFEDLDYVKVTANLVSQTVKFRYLPQATNTYIPETTYTLHGINNLDINAPTVIVTGDNDPNTLYGSGCNVTVRGGQGGDLLSGSTGSTDSDFRCFDPLTFELYGENGNDTLNGNAHRNTLIGGFGHDKADGDRGKDICHAEVERNCELN